jgi:hypothetical protein
VCICTYTHTHTHTYARTHTHTFRTLWQLVFDKIVDRLEADKFGTYVLHDEQFKWFRHVSHRCERARARACVCVCLSIVSVFIFLTSPTSPYPPQHGRRQAAGSAHESGLRHHSRRIEAVRHAGPGNECACACGCVCSRDLRTYIRAFMPRYYSHTHTHTHTHTQVKAEVKYPADAKERAEKTPTVSFWIRSKQQQTRTPTASATKKEKK